MNNDLIKLAADMPAPPAHTGDPLKFDLLQNALSAVRDHLELDIAYMSEFVGDEVVFRRVCAPDMADMIQAGEIGDGLMPGKKMQDQATYCHHVMKGLLPPLIPDTQKLDISRNLNVTRDLRIGAHIGIPIRLKDGRDFGMFCGISHSPKPGLNARDLKTMEMFARLVTEHLDEKITSDEAQKLKHERIDALLSHQAFDVAYQPILNISTMQTVGFEALCRFRDAEGQSPDLVFAEAEDVGRLTELELAVIEQALQARPQLAPKQFISINASPATAQTDAFLNLMMQHTPQRTVLEITEHAQVESYPHLQARLKPLRRRGMRLAVDDAGAGYSSMRHIIQLRPDIIKLDMSITRDLDVHPGRKAFVRAMISFTQETHGHVVAEGIETEAELETLQALGVHKGQGYLLGRPSLTLPAPVSSETKRRA